MLDKIFINFSTSKTSRLFFDFLSSLTRGAKKIQKIFDCIIRGSVFYQKNEGNVYFTFTGFNSHREIRTIYLTTTYPKGGGEEDRFGSRSIEPLGQVTDCVTSLEIRSADYIEVKWNPFLAGRQRTLSILRKLETRVQGLERSILTRLHRIIRDDKSRQNTLNI